jgi:hypothetical protein
MMPMHTTPSGRNQESAHAIALDIAHRHCIEAKRIARNSASVCMDEMCIFTGVKVSASSADSRSGVLPCTYDQIGMAIPIDIARHGWASAESFAFSVTRQGKEPVTIFPRMNVYPSC